MIEAVIGAGIGAALMLIVLEYIGAFDGLKDAITAERMTTERNELVRLGNAVVKEQEFHGYTKYPGVALMQMKKYLEAIKCVAKSAD